MKTTTAIAVVVGVLSVPTSAQETKPVPKDSLRVSIPGCSKGSIFTAGPRTEAQPGSAEIPEGMHLRMNGPKTVLADIKAHEGSMIQITGLMKKGQNGQQGIAIGGGVRITPGPGPTDGRVSLGPNVNVIYIDVEGWRPAVGDCPPR